MRLRDLSPRDAEGMLAWMHDAEATRLLAANFAEKTAADCEAFIASAGQPGANRHWAIADDLDDYMGTVSLKEIRREERCAEFAIATRREAWGKGYAAFAMGEALRRGFEEMGLETIYWYVNQENRRAIRFYEKQGFAPLDAPPVCAPARETGHPQMIWFEARKRAADGEEKTDFA